MRHMVLVFLVRIRFWILDQLIVADRERSLLSRWHGRLRAVVLASKDHLPSDVRASLCSYLDLD